MNTMHAFSISVQVLKVLLIKFYKIQPPVHIFLMFCFYTSADIIFDNLLELHSTLYQTSFFNGFTQHALPPNPFNDQNLLSLTKAFLCSLNPLVQNSAQKNYLPESYPLYSPSYQKFSIYFHLACSPHHVWTVLPLQRKLPFERNPIDGGGRGGRRGESAPATQKMLISNIRKISLTK